MPSNKIPQAKMCHFLVIKCLNDSMSRWCLEKFLIFRKIGGDKIAGKQMIQYFSII